jgi:hypothetical protein
VNTCLITNDVKRLVELYEPILALKAKKRGEDYAEFPTGVGVVAIFSMHAQEKYIPGSAEAAKNRSVVLQFRVSDVDQEYRRLQSRVKSRVKSPTTHILSVGDDDPDFLLFEEPSKVPLLPRLIPAEKVFDHSTHGLEIEVAGEDKVFAARCSKCNLHYSVSLWDFALFEKWQARSLSAIAILRHNLLRYRQLPGFH